MILKFPGVISINNKDIIKDVKLNIESKERKARVKFIMLNENNVYKPFNTAIDIVILKWSYSLSPNGNINVDFIAVDMKSGKEGRGVLSLNIFTKKWKLTGKIGDRDLNISMKGFDSVLMFLNDILLK